MLVGATALLHNFVIITLSHHYCIIITNHLFSQSLFSADTLMKSFPALPIGKALFMIDQAKQGEQNARPLVSLATAKRLLNY